MQNKIQLTIFVPSLKIKFKFKSLVLSEYTGLGHKKKRKLL